MSWTDRNILEFMNKDVEDDEDIIKQVVIKINQGLIDELEYVFNDVEQFDSAVFNLSKYIRIAVLHFLEDYYNIERS